MTSNEIQHVLNLWGAAAEYPLLTTINRIVNMEIPARAITSYAELPTSNDFFPERRSSMRSSSLEDPKDIRASRVN